MRPRILGGSETQSLNTKTQGLQVPLPTLLPLLSLANPPELVGSWKARVGDREGHSNTLLAQNGKGSGVSHGWIQHCPTQDQKSLN